MTSGRTYRVQELLDADILDIGDGYRAKNEELGNQGIPFARAGNIDTGFDFSSADRYPIDKLDRLGPKVSQVGDSLFTSKGTVGRVGYVRADTPRFVYSPQLCYWRSKRPDVLDPRFLNVWMRGAEFRQQTDYLKGQTDMADYVSLRDQRAMSITLPPVQEQQQIAKMIFALDDKTEVNRKICLELEEVARVIFRSWFIDFDPVRAKIAAKIAGRDPRSAATTAISGKKEAEFDARSAEMLTALTATAALFPDALVDSAVGAIPAGWSVKPLDQIAGFLNGLALQKYPPLTADWLPVIKIAQLKKGDTEGADRVSAQIPSEFIVEDGDVLFSWSGSLELDVWCGGRGALNQHLFKVTSERFPKWFYYHWILQHLPSFRGIAAGKAVTMGHIQRRHLTQALCLVPPPSTIAKVGPILGRLLDLQISIRVQCRQLRALRDSLLSRLLSGDLDATASPKEGTIA